MIRERRYPRRAGRRRFAVLAIFAIGFGAALAGCDPSPHISEEPSWQGLDLGGSRVDLLGREGHRGLTVLVFLKTDCPISNRYVPELKDLADELADDPVRMRLIYPNDDAEAVVEHLLEFALDLPGYLDSETRLATGAGLEVMPSAALLDPRGKVLYSGRIDDRWPDLGRPRPRPTSHDLRDAISAALAGREPEARFRQPVGCIIQ